MHGMPLRSSSNFLRGPFHSFRQYISQSLSIDNLLKEAHDSLSSPPIKFQSFGILWAYDTIQVTLDSQPGNPCPIHQVYAIFVNHRIQVKDNVEVRNAQS